MQVRPQSVKKLAKNKSLQLVTAALAGAAAMYAYFETKTLLEITDSDARELQTNVGTGMYETKYGPIFVGMVDPDATLVEE